MGKRDNAYFERRLLDKHPEVYADWKAGSYRSLKAACESVGVMKPRTRLHELKNAWKKATPTEQRDFLGHLHKIGAIAPPAPAASPRIAPASHAPSAAAGTASALAFKVASGQYLTAEAKIRINEILDRRGLRSARGARQTAQVMRELKPPRNPHDPSLGFALARGRKLQEEMIDSLEKWLIEHADV